ncbi:MAG: divergent PAP2 family protein [Ruminococcaceae bacterium]|nr:divergent PAP2 family protein [Oscillospiraceae bacterium]
MDWLKDLFSNPFLLTGLGSWFVAQVLKTILHCIIYKKFDFERLVGDGGMPSGHSATVASLATICGLRCGLASVEFAISAILAIIVCHDATGVRRETGRHAQVLNELLQSLEAGKPIDLKKLIGHTDLKELVGHTPLQVTMGVLIGIGNALLMHYVIL